MYEVDVKCASAYVLQCATYTGFFREGVFVVTECEHNDTEKGKDVYCSRKVSPLELKVVPVAEIESAYKNEYYEKREEPTAVEEFLRLVPEATADVAQEEEAEEFCKEIETGGVSPLLLWICEVLWHIDCLVHAE